MEGEDIEDRDVAAPATPEGDGKSESTMELAPPWRCCFLDEDERGRWFVTDLRTLETKLCPARQWVMTFDDDGFGAITCMAYSQWFVYVRGSKLLGEVSLPSFKLDFPRQNSTWFIESGALYSLLQLKCYSGEVSKWVYESMSSWLRCTGEYGMRDQAMRSIQGLGAEAAIVDSMRVLPRPAMSLKALLCLLWRWCGCNAQQGGLKGQDSKGCAHSLVFSVMQGICQADLGSPFEVCIFLDAKWECSWPRPQKGDCLVFLVSTDGRMDVGAWRDEMDVGQVSPRNIKSKWWAFVDACVGEDDAMLLTDLFQHRADSQKLFLPFFGQILHALADRGERVLSASAQRDAPLGLLRAEAAPTSTSDPRHVDRDLMRHVVSCHQATAGARNISITTDKASVRGVPLQNSLVILPNNEAMVLVPQAVVCPRMPGGSILPPRHQLIFSVRPWCIEPVLGV